MPFNSFAYALFLGVIVALCWSLRQTLQQNILLLAASYFFYACWDWRLLPLLIFTTIVNYAVGRALENTATKQSRLILMTGLCFDLGLLEFFKYFNFFIDSAVKLLTSLVLQANPPSLTIILPI